jgi:hypothetical protein
VSVAVTLRVVEILRAHGVPVTFEPGWEYRGNGQSSAYEGGIIHHTAGSYSYACPGILIYGRSDLSGPLCNFAGLANGGIHVVAAHPANHAGASGGPSNGPFPRTPLFNRLVMGLEICYPGSSPMTDAQYRSATVFARAMDILFGDVERARAHAETSVEGKWDPGFAPGRTIDMGALRRAASAIQQQEEDDMFGEPDRELLRNVNGLVEALRQGLGEVPPGHGPATGKEVQQAKHDYESQHLLRNIVALTDLRTSPGHLPGEGQELPLVRVLLDLAASVQQIKDDVAALKGEAA